MAKRTKKVGILGKYGTRYGSAQRKTIKKFEITQRATYGCPFCGKVREHLLISHGFDIYHCFPYFRTPWEEALLASGDAELARRLLLVVPGSSPPLPPWPPRPPSPVSEDWERRPLRRSPLERTEPRFEGARHYTAACRAHLVAISPALSLCRGSDSKMVSRSKPSLKEGRTIVNSITFPRKQRVQC